MKKNTVSLKIMKQIIKELIECEECETSDKINTFINHINSDITHRISFKCLHGQGCVGYLKKGNYITDAYLTPKGRTFLFDLKMKRKAALLNWSLNVGIAAISALLGAALARLSQLLF